MKSADPARHRKVQQLEKLILEGKAYDPVTKKDTTMFPGDEIVELEPEDELWFWLERKVRPAIPPTEFGYLPVPSEFREILEHGLGYRSRILHQDNQAFVHEVLEHLWAGRAEGRQEKFEKPKTKGKGDSPAPRSTGGNRQPRTGPRKKRRR